VRDLFRDAAQYTGRVAAGWRPPVEDALSEIADESTVEGWDGFGAAAVSFDAIENVRAVCDALDSLSPSDVPPPELTAQSDGEISLTWVPDADRILSVSIGAHNTLNYAAQLGGGREPHGVQRFNPDDVHSIDAIAELLRELYSG
jgi:hypothetical protein